jgi:hypothetical protein
MSPRIVYLFLAWLLAAPARGQDLREVQRSIASNNWSAARDLIDRYLENSPGREEAGAWFYKGKIYTALSKKATPADKLKLQQEALRSFQSYQEMDSLNAMMELDGNAALFEIYDGSYNEGIIQYNKKDYGQALLYFKNALDAKDYIYGKGFSLNGFSFPRLDTQLVNLAARSAWYAKKEEEAAGYLEMLASAGLKAPEYRQVYGLLAEHYCRKGDRERWSQYLARGRELYAAREAYWSYVEGRCLSAGIYELEQGGQSAAHEQLPGKYEELYTHARKSYDLYSKQTALEPLDKEAYRGVLQQLIAYYKWKKDGDKAAHYQEKLKGL